MLLTFVDKDAFVYTVPTNNFNFRILFNAYMQANFYYTETTNFYHLQKRSPPRSGRLKPLVYKY